MQWRAMAASNSKTLSLLFRAAGRKTTTSTATATATAAKSAKSVARSKTLSPKLAAPFPPTAKSPKLAPPSDKHFDVCISYFGKSETSCNNLKLSQIVSSSLTTSDSEPPQCIQDQLVEDSYQPLFRQISSTMYGSLDLPLANTSDPEGASYLNSEKKIPTSMQKLSTLPDSQNRVPQHRKEVSCGRKHKWIFKNTQDIRFQKLIQSYASRFGADLAVTFFGKLGRETGLKEYKTLIGICIDSVKKRKDEGALLEQIYKVYELFKSMKEEGFQTEEQTYGPFLMFLIDMRMVDEFFFFLGIINDENSSSDPRLGYYEMLLAIEVDDETKIQELYNQISSRGNERLSTLQEQYLMALCDGDRKKELLEILERVDITQVSSVENLSLIFSSLGRLSLEFIAVKLISELKECDQRAQSISILISGYATSMRNLAVEEVVSRFRTMHADLELVPSSLSYEKLIAFCCNSLEVNEALSIANQMFAAGLTPAVATINSILHACEDSGEFHLLCRRLIPYLRPISDYNQVHSIYSMLCRFNWKSNSDTYRSLINLSVRMKDIKGAFCMLEDLVKVNVSPTSSMYNAIMAGFYRKKNVSGALEVLERMEAANIKPDSMTFSYLIANSDNEEDIIKYYEKLKSSGIQATKHIFMALINAYANCGQFEEAKQVGLDCGIEGKDTNEVKSVLVSALASNGHIFDALEVYEDMKLGGCSLEPKAIVSLIEHLQSTEKLSTMLQLVDELTDTDYWLDGSCRVIGYCVRNKNLRDAVDLLDEVINKFHDNVIVIESVVNEVFSHVADIEPSGVQFGLDLLQAIKDELMLQPTRRCLDFLLSTCVSAKDSQSAGLIWEEYSAAALPCNILGFLRMYQIFLASGDQKSAEDILKKIQLDDPHVCSVIRACCATYTASGKKYQSKKKKVKKN